MSSVQWYEARPDSLVLITGNETYLASRVVASIKSELRGAHPELEIIEIEDSVYTLPLTVHGTKTLAFGLGRRGPIR